MKYAAAIALATALAAASINATPIKREQPIQCEATPVDQLRVARLKDTKAVEHLQAHNAQTNAGGAHINIIASEGLIGTDANNVFYELYNDPADRAAHFYVQQCNSTALNANQDVMHGDRPIRLISQQDTSLCASAIDYIQAESTSTPLQLKPCLETDNSGQGEQFWAQRANSDTLAFLGRQQDGSNTYWYSETGGGDTYRTPNVMLNPCTDDNCQAGAIDWQLVWD